MNTGSTWRRTLCALGIAGLVVLLPALAAASTLPVPWTNQDVGTTGAAGSASWSNGVFTIQGAGADIWGTEDAFQFVYQPLTGDGEIVARVTGLQNTNTFAKAGIMLRETLSASSSHVILDLRPTGDVEFMTRAVSGGSTSYLGGAVQPAPAWLKLTRAGSTVSASVSSDGSVWRAVGSTTVALASSLYVGVVVTSHVDGTLNTATVDNVTLTGNGGTGSLPPPWATSDVGSTGATGDASYANGTFTVKAAGADIWGTADAFRYVYQPLSGDGQIVARVASLQNTNAFAKAGVMVRETLDPSAPHVILDMRPTGDVEFMTRPAQGAPASYLAGTVQPAPGWLKLVRSGSTLTGSVSSDGTSWTMVGSTMLNVASSVFVGLVVCSHVTGTVNTATFENVSIGGGAANGTATVQGALRVYSTIYSIGVEWDIVGDTNHNATVKSEYRIQGEQAWRPALPLVRVDFNGNNMLAGSTMFLTPNTAYDVRLTLNDPDGGADTRVVSIATRPVPAISTSGRTFHAVPGSGGGDGSAGNPFRGVAAAQAVLAPADVVLLHAGSYGGRIAFNKAGVDGAYIAWKAAGDGEVTMDGIDIAASHLWLEGLTVRNQTYATRSILGPLDVVVTRCQFFNNHYSIYLSEGGTNWYIADNTIVGDTPYTTESLDGEGIELNKTSGHTVAYNSITSVADGISSPITNVDIFGNDIFDTSDDGIEADEGYSNVRMWGNRIHNAVHNGISFQPQNGAPWYIIRNQIVGNKEAAFKFRTTDRFVLLHNTIVNWGTAYPGDAMMCCNEDHMMRAIARNNLWISVQGGQIWGFDTFTKDWRTDLDSDGFDWGTAANPFTYGGIVYPDLASFAAASGLETHGIRVAHSRCFATFDVPNPPPAPVPPQDMTLAPGCNAIDAGVPLPNIDDGRVTGSAPDLGAYEFGVAPPSYGPRPVAAQQPGEVVIYASDIAAGARHGSWSSASDASSPNGSKLVTPDAGVANTASALPAPVDYIDVTFNAAANTPYTLWLRLQAAARSKFNDSIWVQFSDAQASGSAVYPIGSTSGLLVNLATDATASSLNGWGWQNTAYWLSQPTTFTFPTTGPHTVRIQVREDGVELDQIVLSPRTYLSTPPGGPTNDNTIVPKP